MLVNMKDNTDIDNETHIPNELAEFLRQETYSLLIKGYAGTGKTTLALSILKEMRAHKNCLFISTRISPTQLFQYYPWLGKYFMPPAKSETNETSETSTDKSVFIDARLDEPGSLFERITNELMDAKAPAIIIDTWDAIGFFMDKEALMNNVRVLQTWRERAGAKLIFVSETPEDKTFDFLDGIVELRLRHYNERSVREMFLSKLRGIRINTPSCTFSVNNGMFHSYDRYNPSKFLKYANFLDSYTKADSSGTFANNTHLTTGYEELDKLLGGGYMIGGTIFIELDHKINAKVVLPFLGKSIIDFAENDNLIICKPFENFGMETLQEYLISRGISKNSIAIFRPTLPAKKPNNSRTKNLTGSQVEHFQKTVLDLKKKYPKRQLLSILSSDITDELLKSNSNAHELDSFLSFIKSNSALSIFVARRTESYLHSHLSKYSDVHLHILEINGTLFLQSEIPWSHLYAIVQGHTKDQISLEPMV